MFCSFDSFRVYDDAEHYAKPAFTLDPKTPERNVLSPRSPKARCAELVEGEVVRVPSALPSIGQRAAPVPERPRPASPRGECTESPNYTVRCLHIRSVDGSFGLDCVTISVGGFMVRDWSWWILACPVRVA